MSRPRLSAFDVLAYVASGMAVAIAFLFAAFVALLYVWAIVTLWQSIFS